MMAWWRRFIAKQTVNRRMLLNFGALATKRRPNECLACPAHWGRKDAELETPVFPAPLDDLRAAVVAIAAVEPRTHLLRLDKEARQAEFVQRSRVFRFPDVITVTFEALDDSRSTMAIYSRATWGLLDFGVNRRRVERWIAAISERIAMHEPSR